MGADARGTVQSSHISFGVGVFAVFIEIIIAILQNIIQVSIGQRDPVGEVEGVSVLLHSASLLPSPSAKP